MSLRSPYIFSAAMDVDPDKEQLFQEVYDTEHVPLLLKVPGVIAVARFEAEKEMTILMAGQRKRIVLKEGEPRFQALYALERPEVLTSEAWAAAVDRGRWPDQVRPFTRNRQHKLLRLVG
jgi:hypothetical protein